MDIEVLESIENRIRFVVSKATPELVNSLRRTLLSDIPKMAIDKVEFHLGPIMDDQGKEYESVTPLFDEIIAHRIGLVPVPTDLQLFCYRDECNCDGEGCPSCTIMYSLHKMGPCTVYSGDMEALGAPELKVKDELIPIVELNDSQAVLIYAIAELGTAQRHAKWQVANGVGYKYYPLIEIDQDRVDSSDDYVKACPRGVFALEDGKLISFDPLACTLCKACVENFENSAITLSCDDTRFIFEFETDGSMNAKDALVTSLEIMAASFDEFREQVSDLDSKK